MNFTDLSGYQLRAHYLRCINRAQLNGFEKLAEAMLYLYRVQFPLTKK